MNSTDLRPEPRNDSESSDRDSACNDSLELEKISGSLTSGIPLNAELLGNTQSADGTDTDAHSGKATEVSEPCERSNGEISEVSVHEDCVTGEKDQTLAESTASVLDLPAFSNANSISDDAHPVVDSTQIKEHVVSITAASSADDDAPTTTANTALSQEGSMTDHGEDVKDAAGDTAPTPDATPNGEASETLDIHRCTLCQTEFLSLSEFIEHKYHAHRQRMTFSVCRENPCIILPHLAPIDQDSNMKAVLVSVDSVKKDTSKPNGETKQSPHFIGLKCPDCGRLFRHQHSLDKHRQVNHKVYSCEECYVTVTSAWELKKHMKTHTNNRPYVCDVCQKGFKKEAVLQSHLRVHSDVREYKCTECGDSFKTKGSLDRHIRRHTDERPFVCSRCGRSFRESGALSRHHKAPTACHSRRGISVSVTTNQRDDTTTPANTATSSITHSIGTRSQTRAKEVQNELDKPESSSQENESTSQAQDNSQSDSEQNVIKAAADATETHPHGDDHSTAQHVETERFLPYQCRACAMFLDSNDTLREHLKSHISDMPHRCGLCVFAASGRASLQVHMMAEHRKQLDSATLHTPGYLVNSGAGQSGEDNDGGSPGVEDSNSELPPEQLGIFKVAYKQFLELQATGQSSELVTSGVHGFKEMHRCVACNKSFRGKSYLRAHLRKHTGEKPFECNYCPKRFRCKDFLNKHILTHTNERRYKCGECGKLYKRITHVKEHLRIHSQERPFACPQCNKSFKTKTILQTHMKIHTDEAPWKCQFCQKAFREKASVIRHERSHTGEKPYACERCGRAFAEHGTLARHRRAKVPCNPTNKSVVLDANASRDVVMPSVEESTAAASVLAEFSSVVANTQDYIVNIVETNHQGQGGAGSDVEDVIQTVILTESMLTQQQQQQIGEQQQQQIEEQQQQVEEQEQQQEHSEQQHNNGHQHDDHQEPSHEITMVDQIEVPMETEECMEELSHPVSVPEGVMVAMKATDENEVSIVSAGTAENPALETVVIEM